MKQYAEHASGSGKLQFSLTADELNSLVVYDDQFSLLKGVLKFYFSEDRLMAETSFPLARVQRLKGKGEGRFLNGNTEFSVFVKRGKELRAQLIDFFHEGERLQIDSLEALQQINLLRYWDSYSEREKQLNLVKSVEIADGKIFFRNWEKGTSPSE